MSGRRADPLPDTLLSIRALTAALLGGDFQVTHSYLWAYLERAVVRCIDSDRSLFRLRQSQPRRRLGAPERVPVRSLAISRVSVQSSQGCVGFAESEELSGARESYSSALQLYLNLTTYTIPIQPVILTATVKGQWANDVDAICDAHKSSPPGMDASGPGTHSVPGGNY